MLMVIPDLGKVWWLDRALVPTGKPSEDLLVSLYTNDYFPGDDSIPASFTQPTFAGGAPYTLLEGNWAGSVIVAHVAESTNSAPPTWTNTDVITETVFGWFALSSISEICVAAQRFDFARVMAPGAIESLDPATMRLQDFG